jgi:hypothetical protein
MAKSIGLLVKVRGDAKALAGAAKSFGVGRASIRPILTIPPGSVGSALAGGRAHTWFAVDRSPQQENPWDEAHALLKQKSFGAAGGAQVLAVEPDIEQAWPTERKDKPVGGIGLNNGGFDRQDGKGGKAVVVDAVGNQRVAWHLDDDYSRFRAAAGQVGGRQSQITVAHLDTGYDKTHGSVPSGLVEAKQFNTVPGQDPGNATDTAPAGGILTNRGHGAGTLSILAGHNVPAGAPGWQGFAGGPVGAAPGVNVIPIRIADGVVHFTTGTMVAGFDYARRENVHVLTMSMGGLSSAALVDAINLAYEAGITMVTAGGNNFSGVWMPTSIVFPARYRRVIAACGVMGDGAAYAGLDHGTMQGNYGPLEKMATAIGAYTPNLPWAEIGARKIIDMDGAGTSSATPQVAAAAALWLAHYWDTLKTYAPWARVEAVRHALFASAAKTTARMGARETFEKLGNGVLNAAAALAEKPLAESALRMTPPARDSWSWVDLIFNGEISLAPTNRQKHMLGLELTQMAQLVREVDLSIPSPEADPRDIPRTAISRYLEAALDAGNPSLALKEFLEQQLGRKQPPRSAPETKGGGSPLAGGPQGTAKRPVRIVRKLHTPAPPRRRLRIYALDPSVAKRRDTVSIHEATISVPWDDVPTTDEPLKPGPVGEYLEVVDIDPATRRIYDPVNLNDKALLAQDGFAPSEGNPQFHQQMVYAVAMTTIRHFERALGRRALWAPHYDPATREVFEVPRLRIYPHALSTENAYYSPDKIALLFGYFQASSKPGDATSPGTMVFSCLSSDIIAHEMSHALLDGLHRRFQEASNPDVPAFHEGFADIVALFQHFTLRELVKFEIARTRGDLRAENMLAGLAEQFGQGSGRGGPLRDYNVHKMAELDYDTTMEPHDRGSILVLAVYQAFLAIVTDRIASLTRLATGGSGMLPAGALHPGLVDGLTDEVVKTASQVLAMCIRALDYCPAVDITFGEYLRAIITADVDAFPEDPLNYRLAFMEAFRTWKLVPRDVRTVSSETLAWSEPGEGSKLTSELAGRLVAGIDLGWDQRQVRSRIFELNEKNRWALWRALNAEFKKDPELLAEFGLMADVPRYYGNGRKNHNESQVDTVTTFDVFNVRPTRRIEPDGSFRTEVVVVVQQRVPMLPDGRMMLDGTDGDEQFSWFRGGATVILDPREDARAAPRDNGGSSADQGGSMRSPRFRFSIIKNSGSSNRQQRQHRSEAMGLGFSKLRSLYFRGDGDGEPFALLHAHESEDSDG